MDNLYYKLAEVYEAMYQTFIDYESEYICYGGILEKYKKKEVLEIGCGTGNLAGHFLAHGFSYTGLDLSDEMIKLAKGKGNECDFIQGNMCDFILQQPVESAIITARTISYLLSNKTLKKAFANIRENLQTKGILCFDFIDANQFIPMISKGKELEHTASFEGIDYIRKSYWETNFENGMDFKWHSIFYKKEGKDWINIGEDHSIIRTFTINELEIMLTINGFKIKELIARETYAFPTYVLVAEKK